MELQVPNGKKKHKKQEDTQETKTGIAIVLSPRQHNYVIFLPQRKVAPTNSDSVWVVGLELTLQIPIPISKVLVIQNSYQSRVNP